MRNFNVKINKNSLFEKDYVLEYSYIDNTKKQQNTNNWIKLFTGVIIGFVNGFWGGGGGMICVPLLTNIVKLSDKKAHATTLLIMLPLSIASLIIYITKGNLPIIDSLKIGIGFITGGLIGAYFLKIISNALLGIVFSLIIIAGGIKMLL